jgi:predicted ferric reductase
MDYVKKIILVGFFFVALASAIGLPFVYESQTLWYKIGLDKTMLRAGQLSGMLALTLLFTQVLLAVGGSFLQKSFGLKNLMSWHRAWCLNCCFFTYTCFSYSGSRRAGKLTHRKKILAGNGWFTSVVGSCRNGNFFPLQGKTKA